MKPAAGLLFSQQKIGSRIANQFIYRIPQRPRSKFRLTASLTNANDPCPPPTHRNRVREKIGLIKRDAPSQPRLMFGFALFLQIYVAIFF